MSRNEEAEKELKGLKAFVVGWKHKLELELIKEIPAFFLLT